MTRSILASILLSLGCLGCYETELVGNLPVVFDVDTGKPFMKEEVLRMLKSNLRRGDPTEEQIADAENHVDKLPGAGPMLYRLNRLTGEVCLINLSARGMSKEWPSSDLGEGCWV